MSQVIKYGLPIQYFYILLDEYILNKKIFITKNLYKKLVIDNTSTIFLQNIEPYYYASKKFYCTRDMTYNRFITVLRQICKYFNISYNSKILYYNSGYENTLLIFV